MVYISYWFRVIDVNESFLSKQREQFNIFVIYFVNLWNEEGLQNIIFHLNCNVIMNTGQFKNKPENAEEVMKNLHLYFLFIYEKTVYHNDFFIQVYFTVQAHDHQATQTLLIR